MPDHPTPFPLSAEPTAPPDLNGPRPAAADAGAVPAGEAGCPACGAGTPGGASFCPECGLIFPDGPLGRFRVAAPGKLVGGRYRVGELIGERGGVRRFRGLRLGEGRFPPVPVILVRQRAAEGDALPPWPGLDWEQEVLGRALHLSLPRVLDRFTEDGFDYLVEEFPVGTSLWEFWADPAATTEDKYDCLAQVAGAMRRLYEAGAVLEGLRPGHVVVTPTGTAVLYDLTDLLPLPLPPGAEPRGTPYTAPELLLDPERAGARAGLYGFGATLYALHLGRELTEDDAPPERGGPRPFLDRFPDAHPLLARLIGKTFSREPGARFPSDEYVLEDPSGFAELAAALAACGRQLGRYRPEIACWTSTGIARGGNEDAVAVLQASRGLKDEFEDAAVLILADGMGGMDHGEVAAALTVEALREFFLALPPFAGPGPDSGCRWGEEAPADSGADDWEQRVAEALREANRRVFEAARRGPGPARMGSTAEVVYLDGRRAVVGHVGDSRVYRLHGGVLTQVTRDQTLVSRLVELGQLTPAEAARHPRRSELRQAIGGRRDVDPAVSVVPLRPGDWLLVCSDGLTEELPPERIREVLREAPSAERAARRLVNEANRAGAADNVTVIVVRAAG